MAVKVALTIEQIAETLRGLKRDEIETLEIMLDSNNKKNPEKAAGNKGRQKNTHK